MELSSLRHLNYCLITLQTIESVSAASGVIAGILWRTILAVLFGSTAHNLMRLFKIVQDCMKGLVRVS
jgi:hypothetical protein